MEQQWVERVRALLTRASHHQKASGADLAALKSSLDEALQQAQEHREAVASGKSRQPYPIRRKHLLAQIRLKLKHYALSDEVQAFVYATGLEVLEQLDNDQLCALNAWLQGLCEAAGMTEAPFQMSVAC